MAEECKCTMLTEFKYMQEAIKKVEEKGIETEKVVYEIKDGHAQTKFVMEQIQKTQDAQAILAEKHQLSQALSTKEYQIETARLNKENQAENIRLNKEQSDKMDANFKAIEDKRIADEKAIALKKEADEKNIADEKEKAKIKSEAVEAERIKDAKELLKEKRSTRRAMWMALYVLILSSVFGLFVKYAPHVVGL